ncbi:MAG TPA: DUF3303 family protein [Chthonomonadaceae bacterium]|nr:DUF3303 family protein [Chthonomonadaceae bacterium]
MLRIQPDPVLFYPPAPHVLWESDDAKALTEFSMMWSDVMTLQIIPVVEDQDLVEVLERTGR